MAQNFDEVGQEIKRMKENKYLENSDDYFEEQLFELGFELIAVKDSNEIPINKSAFLLITKDNTIRRKLFKWAKQNNFVVLFNPDEIIYEQCNNLFAFIIDEDLKKHFPYPKLLENKYLPPKLGIELLQDFLETLYNNY